MSAAEADELSGSDAVPLLEPREGLPNVTTTPEDLSDVVTRLRAGSGPVAVDAERASGYRYGQRAFLVQLRRAGTGTVLIDPVPLPDLGAVSDAIASQEWVLHAAAQDLPCLADLGMRPSVLFDTELAGRLLNLPRVGLGPLVENVLGYALEKGHSAADWSTRPLPEPWLRYAALDVEVLVELRDELAGRLALAGKLDWALEEFAAIAAAPPHTVRPEPWRRTSGMHRVRGRRPQSLVRALWEARDELAEQRDIAPGRLLTDAAIVEAALAAPRSRSALDRLPGFHGRGAERFLEHWWRALEAAYQLPEDELPIAAAPNEGPPPTRAWAERDPAAAARLVAARTAVAALADEHDLPSENLLAPDLVRRLCWEPPDRLTEDVVAEELASMGARTWQVRITGGPVARALNRLRTRGEA
ncbi:MAG: HRDC domain-containing protein [Candidatus Nanopelagicales bacterium]